MTTPKSTCPSPNSQVPASTGPEHQRLEVLVGRWKTEGTTRPVGDDPAATIDAVDTYTRLPGGRALLHSVDARVGDQHVEGAEIIGWDEDRQTYVTQYFGTDGPNRYEAILVEEEEALLWKMSSNDDRFTGRFSSDRNTITGHWELKRDDGQWGPWMDITLTKRENASG
jgi:hypothetical protein